MQVNDDPLICPYCFSSRLYENKGEVQRKDKLWVYLIFHFVMFLFFTTFFLVFSIITFMIATQNRVEAFREFIQGNFGMNITLEINYLSIILIAIATILYLVVIYFLLKKISRHPAFTKLYKTLNVPIPTWEDIDRFNEKAYKDTLKCRSCFRTLNVKDTIYKSQMDDFFYSPNNPNNRSHLNEANEDIYDNYSHFIKDDEEHHFNAGWDLLERMEREEENESGEAEEEKNKEL